MRTYVAALALFGTAFMSATAQGGAGGTGARGAAVGATAAGPDSAARGARQGRAAAPTMLVPGKSPVYAPNGIAATSQPLATSAAIATMQKGGNAIDAAIAAAAVLSVVEPMMTGIGGDMFAIVWSAKDKRLYGLNASGRAGSLMTQAELTKRGRTRMVRGPETVTVPGALMGWQTLLTRFGTMKLPELLEPAIGYAERGFPVTPVIAGEWGGASARDSGMKQTFLVEGGTRAPRAGEWFRNPTYAATLREISKGGIDVFYNGPLGQKIVNFLQANGGFLTMDDLKKNQPTWVTPISVMFQGYRVWEMPPNNLGLGVLEMLRILDGYDLKGLGRDSPQYWHYLIEAKKLAYADQARYVGDPDNLKVSVEYLLSDKFINQRRAQIDPRKASTTATFGPAGTVGTETIYLTVADKDGNMVSFINSQFDEWGSNISAPGTGFSLQDRGLGFTLEQGLANTAAPGKRPAHTLIPGFVTKPGSVFAPDGLGDEPFMSFGLMGGSMQAQGHAQFIINMLVFGMNVQQAQDAARFRHNSGVNVSIESAVPGGILDALRAMGHNMSISGPGTFGGSQAIVKLTQGYVAGSDSRKDGHAAGY